MLSSGMLGRVALVRTGLSEERSASIMRVKRIGDLRTSAVTSNRHMQRRNTMFLHEPYDVTSQMMAFFIVAAAETSNLT
jgi:hypothetical protein